MMFRVSTCHRSLLFRMTADMRSRALSGHLESVRFLDVF